MSPLCPICESVNSYQYGNIWNCGECGHEWIKETGASKTTDEKIDDNGVRDSNGVLLASGDSVIVIKDLKIKGASSVVKGGTKVRNIRLTDEVDGHNIACKIEGIGSINLKSEFVRKA